MIRNVSSNWIGFLLTGTIQLLLTPILIKSLGDFDYGIWVLAFSVLAYTTLLDMGMHTTMLRFVAKSDAENRPHALNEILFTSIAVVSAIAVIAVIIMLVLVWLTPDLLDLPVSSRPVFRWLIILLGSSIVVELFIRVLGNYLCGLHRFDFYNGAKVACSLLRALLMVGALGLGYGLLGLAGASFFTALVSLPLHWIFVRFADPLLASRGIVASWGTARALMRFAFFSFVSTLGNYLRFYLNSVVIARILMVELITPFNIAVQIVEYFRSIVIGAMSPLITSFSHLTGKTSDHRQFTELFVRATRYTTLLCLFVGCMLFLNGKTLITLWVGERFLASYPLLLILTTAYVLMLSQVPSNALFYALNKHQAMAVWTLAEGGANVALSAYLAHKFGLVGVAFGIAIPMTLVSVVVQPWYVLRLLELSLRGYVLHALARPLTVAAVFLLFCQVGISQTTVDHPLRLIWNLCWQSGLFGALTYTIGLNHEDRRIVLRLAQQGIPKLVWVTRKILFAERGQ